MAGSLQHYEPQLELPRARAHLSRPKINRFHSESPAMARWEMRIGLGQVIILWSVLAGIMVCVFLFGYHAGREQGWSKAVEEAGSQAVRLTVPQAIATQSDIEASAGPGVDQLAGMNPNQGPSPLPSGQETVDPSSIFAEVEPTAASEEFKFDFSQSNPLPGSTGNTQPVNKQVEQAAGAGFSGKSVVDLANQSVDKPTVSKPAPITAQQPQVTETKPVVKTTQPAAKQESTTAPRVAPEPVPAPAGEITAPASGWYVQVAATRAAADARSLVNRFAQAGHSAAIEQAKVSNRLYFRVLVGPYSSQQEAQSGQSELKRAKLIKGEPFLKRVK